MPDNTDDLSALVEELRDEADKQEADLKNQGFVESNNTLRVIHMKRTIADRIARALQEGRK